jgi:peptidoglycan/xylan/chitin deacetylase (PgdA/CDA1 family)
MNATSSALTVVMYHFVQEPDSGPVAGLKQLDVAAFRQQLGYIRRHYTPVAGADVIGSFDAGEPLPPRPILLTFDDGYRCHVRDVLPLLEAEAISALFFPVASAALDRRVLDVNKIQCVLAVSPDVAALVAAIEAAVEAAHDDGPAPTIAELRARCWQRSRWDPEPVVYVKRLLQHVLPERIRRPLVDTLFAERVSRDERSFADELYMSVEELRDLRARGMMVGAHGDRHLRLPTLGDEEQRREIDGALRLLDVVGVPRRRFTYCYANGEHDARSVARLRALGCAIAFTTRPDLAHLISAEALTLPRLDANDLPSDADAEPNDWARRAGQPS